MKYLIIALGASALLASAPAFAAGDEGPAFDKGPVWDFTQIKTVDGHFDDYMKWLSTDWKAQQEALKKAGRLVDYKVFIVADPRPGEADLILANEYKNMAEFDRTTEDEYAMQAKIAGSIAKANQEQAGRATIRTIQGDAVMREVMLK